MSPAPMIASTSKRPCAGSASQILPNLFISDLAFAESAPCLANAGITHVLSILPEPITVPATAAGRRIQRKQVRIEDSPFAELAAHLPSMVRFIEEALSTSSPAIVLVHCAEGVSRSVAVAAAYLVKAHGRTPMDALRHIAARRRIARPNFGFVQQLHEYARDHLGRDIALTRRGNPTYDGPSSATTPPRGLHRKVAHSDPIFCWALEAKKSLIS
ncbi:protein-tyrosine phosphatase-like protein [Schizophyllum commune]